MRLALGNGLRPDVWPRFKARFGIERVAELYASTEGNANLANTEGKEGAVGFISPLLAPVYPVRLVRLADSSAAGVSELCLLLQILQIHTHPNSRSLILW